MEPCVKPTVRRGRVLLKYAAMLLLLIFFGGDVLLGLDACRRFSQAQRDAVTVDAVVCSVRQHEDDEGANEYDVYVRYIYAGGSYEVLYLDDSDDKSWTEKVGQSIALKINPHQPEEIIDRLEAKARGVVMNLWFLNLGLWIWAIPSRKSWTEIYGNDRTVVKKDLENQIRRRWVWKWGVLTGTEMIALNVIFLKVIPVWVLIVGVILLILGVKGGRRYDADLNKVSGDAFRIQTDTLVEKWEDYDSDGGKDYILVFSDGKNTWQKTVSYDEYHSVLPGQTQCVVYLEGETRPTLALMQSGAQAV